ncbi:MAG TPA: ATP-binding protein [Methylomirabilota bacterium]|nr:ATP-binding protein [Methylomirabilota bacterium]
MTPSLRAMLLGFTGLAVLTVELSGLGFELRERITAGEMRIAAQSQRLTSAVAPLLLNTLVVGDLATAEQTLRDINHDSVWREVRLMEPDGQRLIFDASPTPATTSHAPGWLRAVLRIDPSETRTRVATGTTQYAVLAVRPSAASLEGELWYEIRQRVLVSALLVGSLLVLMNIIFGRALRPVRELGATAARLGAGDLSVRMPETRLREIADTAQAFNSMAVNLERILGELREKEAANRRLAAIVEQSEEAILTVDLEERITSWNIGAEHLLGRRAGAMLGQPLHVLLGEAAGDPAEVATRLLAPGPSARVDLPFRAAGGQIVEVAVAASPLYGDDGERIGHIIVARDITERKRAESERAILEAQLRQSQKMEAVGRLAGGVAHDFNNVLTVIAGRSQFLRVQMRDGDPLIRHVDLITQGAERAAKLTAQLLAFSRRQVLQPKVLDLNAVVAGVVDMLHRLIGENIELVTVPGRELGHVLADPGQIEQVLLNLVVNARDAMPSGGRLSIATANVDRDESMVRNRMGAKAGRFVMLSVSDTGVGMSEETKARLFEPFFTTKGPGVGTGLGLATVYGIVKQSGGDIWAYSELGRGTSFKVYLPRVDKPAEIVERVENGDVRGGSERILLVEDENDLRDLALEVLEVHGYRVLVAADPVEAERLSGQHREAIDLLLTDVIMPHMSGRELAERLLSKRPSMRVLYTSGYTDDALAQHGVLGNEIFFLQKPYSPDGLARKVREVLDTPA